MELSAMADMALAMRQAQLGTDMSLVMVKQAAQAEAAVLQMVQQAAQNAPQPATDPLRVDIKV